MEPALHTGAAKNTGFPLSSPPSWRAPSWEEQMSGFLILPSYMLLRLHVLGMWAWEAGVTSAYPTHGTETLLVHSATENYSCLSSSGSSSTLGERCKFPPRYILVSKLGCHSIVSRYPCSQTHGSESYTIESSTSLSKVTNFICNNVWKISSLRIFSKTVEVVKAMRKSLVDALEVNKGYFG